MPQASHAVFRRSRCDCDYIVEIDIYGVVRVTFSRRHGARICCHVIVSSSRLCYRNIAAVITRVLRARVLSEPVGINFAVTQCMQLRALTTVTCPFVSTAVDVRDRTTVHLMSRHLPDVPQAPCAVIVNDTEACVYPV